ncbi:MAG: PHP domain-containing protein [Actinobacteria bacterium]|nr:PHP domain-containing protein [Actinomycetota bacterium]
MIDLHTHTSCSDGTDSPLILVNKALSQGVKVLGLTDHDSTQGWDEAKRSLRAGLQLVPGAEISCLTKEGLSVHMLGLLFDGENPAIIKMLAEIKDNRVPRALKIIELLNAAGFEITFADVEAAKPAGATLGRPHIADALVKLGVVNSRDEAFKDLLHNDSPYYVSHLAPLPADAIRQIRAAGGVAVIAHPSSSLRGRSLDVDSFADMAIAGLNGIEVDHRDQDSREREVLRAVARELGLAVTGSSDYHGTGKMNQLGECTTDPAQWEMLEAGADQRRVVTA